LLAGRWAGLTLVGWKLAGRAHSSLLGHQPDPGRTWAVSTLGSIFSEGACSKRQGRGLPLQYLIGLLPVHGVRAVSSQFSNELDGRLYRTADLIWAWVISGIGHAIALQADPRWQIWSRHQPVLLVPGVEPAGLACTVFLGNRMRR